MAQLNHYLSDEMDLEITKIAARLECSRQDVFRLALVKAYPQLAKVVAASTMKPRKVKA
jgi:hypothetical protein